MKLPFPFQSPRAAIALVLSLALASISLAGNGNANGKNKSPTPAPAPTVTATAYSGQAVALKIDGVTEPVPGPIIIADTGLLASTGGSLVADVADYELLASDGVTVALGIDLAHASTYDSGSATNSDSSLSGLQILFQDSHGELVEVTADYVGGSAVASLAANGSASAAGSVSISNLRINGVLVPITGEPGQVVDYPDVHIVINEQQTVTGNGEASITLTALKIDICNCLFGAYGVVTAGIKGGSNPPQDHDCGKLTGGGWIVGPSGAKATFAVSGGIRRDEFWGHLQYNDHGAGLKVKSTRVTGFAPKPGDPHCRIINYDVTINGLAGTAVVEACDHGEPGRDDTFSIKLSTGYAAGGSLGGDGPGGGNIQLHKCPPGWDK